MKKNKVHFMILKPFCSVSADGMIAVRNPGELYSSEDDRIWDLVDKGLVMMDLDLEERK